MNFQEALSHMQLEPGLAVKRESWEAGQHIEIGDGKLFTVRNGEVFPVEYLTPAAILAEDWRCVYNAAQALAHISGDEQVGVGNG